MVDFVYQFIFLISLVYYLLYLRSISDISFYALVLVFGVILSHYAIRDYVETFTDQASFDSCKVAMQKYLGDKIPVIKHKMAGWLQKGGKFLSSLKQKWISS